MTASINNDTGIATFHDLSFSSYGRYFLQYRIVSMPEEFDVIVPSMDYFDIYPEGVYSYYYITAISRASTPRPL